MRNLDGGNAGRVFLSLSLSHSILSYLGLELLEVALGKAQRVKGPARVARLRVGDAVALEDGVVVDRPVLLHVLPAAHLDKVHEQELPGQQAAVVELAGGAAGLFPTAAAAVVEAEEQDMADAPPVAQAAGDDSDEEAAAALVAALAGLDA